MAKKKRFKKSEIVRAVVEYIIENGPVTHTKLETRAQSMSWYSIAAFDAIIEVIHRHPQITSSVRTDDVYYLKKVSRPRKKVEPPKRPDYPEPDPMMGIHEIFYEIDHSCNCTLHASREEIEEFKKNKTHARLCNLNPIQAERIDNLYNIYYERGENPDRNTEKTPVQGSLMLEK